MAATLTDIRLAILAALRTVLRPAGPFVAVGDVRGEPSVGKEPGEFEAVLGGRTNGALLRFESERVVPSLTVQGLNGPLQVVAESTWRVYVVVQDPRTPELEAGGTTAFPGLLTLTESVRNALQNLFVATPAATLRVAVTGTANATVDTSNVTLSVGDVAYKPSVSAVTLNGAGEGTLDCTCVTPNCTGNQVLGTSLDWSATPPNADPTARVLSIVTPGKSGLFRRGRLTFVEQQHHGTRPGQIAVELLKFSALREVCFTDEVPQSNEDLLIWSDVDLEPVVDPSHTNPVAQFEAP